MIAIYRAANHERVYFGVSVPTGADDTPLYDIESDDWVVLEATPEQRFRTPEEADAIYDAAHETNLAALEAKRTEVAEWWQTLLTTGYMTTSFGIELAWDEATQDVVNKGLALLDQAISLGLTTLASSVEGWEDRHGSPIKISDQDPTIAQVRQMVLEMGLAFSSQRALRRSYERELDAGRSDFVVGESVEAA